MRIIISHDNTDFDGLAAMVAAKKLYPDAVMVFPGRLCRNVEDFMALHKDTISIRLAKDIPPEEVTSLILVDIRSARRLGPLQKLANRRDLPVHIYDHHPPGERDFYGTLEVTEYLGAATTLLVELIKEAGIKLNALEATVLALGIYEDTGCLTFSTSTARDAAAIAFLLEHGANLKVIADFIERPMSEAQKALLNELIKSSKRYVFQGIEVLIATSSVDDYIGGLALLTHKLADLESVDVIVSIVEMEDRVHLVARSRVDQVSVCDLLETFGGGGHDKAASATVKDLTVEEALSRLLETLKTRIRPMTTAAQLMSAPVKTVSPDTSIAEAGKIMLRYGHTGFPVVGQDREIVGIISRRDVDKAMHHGLGHAPVKGYMSRRVVAISPDVPLPEIQRLLIEHQIGRLPVVEDGKLLGIVSRTDILRTLHGESYPETFRQIFLAEGSESSRVTQRGHNLLAENLPPKIQDILSKVCYLATHRKVRVYVVGGFVRDMLLRVENFDLDLVVEGDGIAFARVLAEYFCGRVRVHEKFGTAVVVLPDEFKLDVASARTEFYEYPAALPRVETSTLKEDLYRRDFTINAMAVDLRKEYFGALVDWFGGRGDLERKTVRILHTLSFVEDPTRVFRAIRFEQRYDFTMESQTLELAKKAIRDNWLQKLSYDRIREELKHIFNEEYPVKAISRMRELGLWQRIAPEVEFSQETWRVLDNLPLANSLAAREVQSARIFQPWLTYFAALVHQLDVETADSVCGRFKLSKEEHKIVRDTVETWAQALQALDPEKEVPLSAVARGVGGLSREAFAFILAKAEDLRVWELVKRYLHRAREAKLAINGYDLKELGCPHGPLFQKVLRKVWLSSLDSPQPLDREAQLRLAGRLIRAGKRGVHVDV